MVIWRRSDSLDGQGPGAKLTNGAEANRPGRIYLSIRQPNVSER
jgi:hypothetical protein